MKELWSLVKRNNKIFFKDKGMFFTSLITPVILLVLYVTFLASVYKDSFKSFLPEGLNVSDSIINGCVGGQLLSSLLAVSCVTVSFCSNLLMVQDKAIGSINDLMITPVKSSKISLGYFISSSFVTLIINLCALGVGLIYLAFIGWYLSFLDVVLIVLDIILLVLFATSLSSLINCNLKSNGQASAVGTIISSGYGFICGAYMPISNFSPVLQKIISFLPGTYGTALLRNHSLKGVYRKMSQTGFSKDVINNIDCNVYFFDNLVNEFVMYIILILSVSLLTLGYILLCKRKNKKCL